jgi:hypothetical protein
VNLDRWLSVSQAAELAGVKRRTMLRRLWYLQSESGQRIMRRVGARKLEVSAEALQRALRTDPELRDAELAGIASRVDDHERKLLALRNAHKSLKKQVKTLAELLR